MEKAGEKALYHQKLLKYARIKRTRIKIAFHLRGLVCTRVIVAEREYVTNRTVPLDNNTWRKCGSVSTQT